MLTWFNPVIACSKTLTVLWRSHWTSVGGEVEVKLHVAGGGGSSGSATLDRLMDRIPFGPKPKIVDLTSDRKLADKVWTCTHCAHSDHFPLGKCDV